MLRFCIVLSLGFLAGSPTQAETASPPSPRAPIDALANPIAAPADVVEASAHLRTPQDVDQLDVLIAEMQKQIAEALDDRPADDGGLPPGGAGPELLTKFVPVEQGAFKFALQDIDDNLTPASFRSLPSATLFVTDAGPDTVDKRLKLEGLEQARDIAPVLRRPESGVAEREAAAQQLRGLFASTGSDRIVTTLTTTAVGTGAAGFALTEETLTRMQAAVTQPEQLATFQRNIARAVEEDAIRPGALRIVKGRPIISPDPFPDTLMTFGFVDNAPQMCSAVLVAPDYAITAAHCLCNGAVDQVMIGTSLLMDPRRVGVDLQASRSHIDCEALKTPAGFLESIGQGDFALLKLKEPVTDVAIRPLATETMIRDAAAVRAVGFGISDAAPNLGLRGKFAVDIAIASYDCTDIGDSFPDADYQCAATHELVAAGFGRDTCGGDSGGPIYIFGADLHVYLAGITSRAVDPTGNCGPGGIYVKLSTDRFTEWLTENGVTLTVSE